MDTPDFVDVGRAGFSNFEPWTVAQDGCPYRTLEHAFQAAKTIYPDEKDRVARCATPAQAKRAGRKVSLRADWEAVKVDVMRDLLRLKFAEPGWRERLLDTGTAPIVEHTTWHDQVWGVCTCPRHKGRGRNLLGSLLEEVRAELRPRSASSSRTLRPRRSGTSHFPKNSGTRSSRIWTRTQPSTGQTCASAWSTRLAEGEC
jgi:hypothetical protein